MILNILQSMTFSYFTTGNERSLKAKQNILAMLALKGGSIVCSLLLVTIVLRYVNADTYGIWLTLSSMVAWISFLDIGLNNGLKNKLSESLANGDIHLAKQYVSTTYALLSIIFIPVMTILLIVTPFIDWNSVLNLPSASSQSLTISICIIIAYFCINFILSTINIVLQAVQRPALSSFQTFCQQILTLAIICILTIATKGDLVILCLCFCISPIIVVSLFNIVLFNKKYKSISPSYNEINFSLASSLLKLGVKFFLIQIAGIVQYQMVNFLIIRNYGSAEVTSYNIAFKYFNVIYMIWTILTTPIWAAVTDAITKGDIQWIKNMVSHYLKFYVFFAFVAFLMLTVSSYAYHIWVGDSVSVSFSISFWVMIFNLVMMFGTIFVSVLNGAGILNLQTIACIFSPLLFLGLFYFLQRSGLGVESIIISSVVANFNGLILAPIQYYRYVKSTSK